MKEANTQEQNLRRKPLNAKVNRHVRFTGKGKQSGMHSPQFKTSLKGKIRQNESILQANVSLIQGSSFFSNKQDGSLDSMDKMIIGVGGLDGKQFQDEEYSRGSALDIDFTALHMQYEELIGKSRLLGEDDEQENSNEASDNRFLPTEQEDWPLGEQKKIEKVIQNMSPRKKSEFLGLNLHKLQLKIEQLKPYKRIQDISNNSIKILAGNLGNLSEIHEERQNCLNNSVDTQQKRNHEQDEEEFIDFVSQPDPQEPDKQNKKAHSFSRENQENQWEEVSPMLAHLQLQLLKDKNFISDKSQKPQTQKHHNYQHILSALDSKEEDDLQHPIWPILSKREEWIKKKKPHRDSWKQKQLKLLLKIQRILKDPYYDSENSEDDKQ